MTQLFGRFSASGAPLQVPGAAFFAAAALAGIAFCIYGITTRRAVALTREPARAWTEAAEAAVVESTVGEAVAGETAAPEAPGS